MGAGSPARRRRDLDAGSRRRDDAGDAAHAVRLCARRVPAGVLARTHPVYRTPIAAIVVQCVLVLVLAISSTFERLAILANLSTLLLYAMCCLATWQLRRRDVRSGGTPFKVPMPGLVIVLACS